MKLADKEVASKPINSLSLLGLTALLIGATIRLFEFSRWSLHNDELSTIFRAKYDSLAEVILLGVKTDVHPMLNEVFIYFWMNLFGDSPFAVRLPYVILSIIGLYFAYKFITKLYNSTVAILSLIVLSCTQLFVIYSQLARPYALGICLLMIFCYAWINLIHENKWKWVLLTGLFGCLSAMTHYFLGLSILLVFLLGFSLISYDKKSIVYYLISGILSLLFFLPHLTLSLHQINRKGLGWLPPPESDFLLDFIHYSLNESYLLITVVLIAPFLGLLINRTKTPQFSSFLFPLIFLISFAIGYFYSIQINPVLQFSALIFSFPFFIIFLFSFFPKLETKVIKIYASLLFIVCSSSLVVSSHVFGPKRFGNFEGVAEKLIEWKKAKGDDLLIFSNSSSSLYLDYYYKYFNFPLEEKIDYFNAYESLRNARDFIQKSNTSYLALGFANSPIPSEVYEYARIHYPYVIEHHRYFNSDVLLLSNQSENKIVRDFSFRTFPELTNDAAWEVRESLLEDSLFFSPPNGYKITPTDEFALTYRTKVEEVFQEWPDWVILSAYLKSEDTANVKLVVELSRNGENIDWRGIDSKLYYAKENWYQMLFVYPLPAFAEKDDDLLIYFWNPEKSNVFIDNLQIVNYQDANFDYYQLK